MNFEHSSYSSGCIVLISISMTSWQEKREETQMLFFQFPANLPLPKQPAATTNTKDAAGKIDRASKKGCKLEELQPGFMGKLLVYKSGKVKMKLGDALFDVSCIFLLLVFFSKQLIC